MKPSNSYRSKQMNKNKYKYIGIHKNNSAMDGMVSMVSYSILQTLRW
jgi:hypothetical protein